MEQELRPSEVSRRKRHRRRRMETTALGTAVLLLAAVGVIFLFWKIISLSVGYVKSYLGPAETTTFYESYIAPVVMQDPEPFSSTASLDSDWVVKTAIWAALNDDENSGKYALADDGREIIPVSDIKKKIASLFGEDYQPKLETFTDPQNSATYEYSKKNDCFYIPMIAYSDYFTPNIRTVTRKNGTVTLAVDYISGQGWVQDSAGTAVTPSAASKTMIYVLKGSRGQYQIVSVQAFPSGSSVSGSSSGSSVSGSSSGSSVSGGSSGNSVSGSSSGSSSNSSSVSKSGSKPGSSSKSSSGTSSGKKS
ncbi:MAG: hypothetical protein P4L75_03775 [Clostridia bacterium]|nr:hypothetical protein [Clostridia bacterium]